ncbi:nickel pincer cofactor biosynthesis protein LarC [bacterium]|nr:nickel pincer cofactor biosynthesis protein LarC [bacterium]
MTTAFFDIISGISGDMTLGAFVSAGVSFDALKAELAKLPLKGYTISQRTLMRSMVATVKIDVEMDAGEHEHHHRGLHAIEEIITTSGLSSRVQERAMDMFRNLAHAEARVHDTTPDKVHFHEVGAVDSIVDIVGVAICMELSGVERVYTSPVRTGSGGFVNTQHGRMPIPTPATVELLKGYPTELTDIPYELTTPTGATIVATLSDGMLPPEAGFIPRSIGYGSGGKDIPGTPNMLRLMIGEVDDQPRDETLLQFDTNIDDMNPELFPFVLERLLAAGVNDAWLTPIQMKKGRPAMQLSVLAVPGLRDDVLQLLYAETSTAGVRVQEIRRHRLPREQRRCMTRFGEVVVKAVGEGEDILLIPEHEECRRVAQEHNLPLIQVYREIEQDLAQL